MNTLQDYQINKFSSNLSLRDIAFITFIRQSGLNPNTIKKLKISNVEGKILENSVPIPCKIEVPKEFEKNGIGRHPSFIAEEATNHLFHYLRNRQLRFKEEITNESLLFIVESKPTKQINLKEINRKLKKISKNTLTLNDIREFFKQKGEQIGINHLNYITGNKNYRNYIPEKDEYYKELYEQIIDSLQIEPISPSRIHRIEKENKMLIHQLKVIQEAVGQFLKKPEKLKEGEMIEIPILDPFAVARKINEEILAYEEYKEIQQRKEYDDEMRQDYEESNQYQMELEHQEDELNYEAEERGITREELDEELAFAKFAYEYEQKKEENAKMKKLQEAYGEIIRKSKSAQSTT